MWGKYTERHKKRIYKNLIQGIIICGAGVVENNRKKFLPLEIDFWRKYCRTPILDKVPIRAV